VGDRSNLVIGGYSNSYSSARTDFWLLQTDMQGNFISNATVGVTDRNECYGVAINDSGIYLGGRSFLSADRSLIARCQPNGDVIWANVFDDPSWSQEVTRGLAPMPFGSVFCAGWCVYQGSTQYNPAVYTVDYRGGIANQQRFANIVGQLWDVIALQDGGFLSTGSTTSGTPIKGLLMRFKARSGIVGVIRSRQTHLPIPNVRVGTFQQPFLSTTNAQGHYVLSLQPGVYNVLAWGTCVTAETTRAVQVWEDSVTANNMELFQPRLRLRTTSVNTAVYNHIANTSSLVLYNDGNGAMQVRLSAVVLQPLSHWLTVEPAVSTITPHDSLTITVRIAADTVNTGMYDFSGMIYVRANSCPDSVQVIPVFATVLRAEENAGIVPQEFTLSGAYPNPFNASTTVRYAVPRQAAIRLALYDLLGREVRVLEEGWGEAGWHAVRVDAADLPSGIYWVNLRSGTFSQSTKIVLLK
jgi:hypothetical protein